MTDLSWILLNGMYILMVFVFFTCCYLLYTHYRKFRDAAIIHLIFSSFFYGLTQLFVLFANLSGIGVVYRLSVLPLTAMALTLTIAISFMIHGRIRNYLLWLIIALGTVSIYSSCFRNDSIQMVSVGDHKRFVDSGFYVIFISLLTGIVVSYFLYYTIRVYLRAPKNLKSFALINLFALIMLGPGTILGYVLGNIFLQLGMTIWGIGLYSIVFFYHPELLYILPFQAKKLLVVDKNTGMTIYQYNWHKEEITIQEELFSTVLKAISSFIDQILGLGEVQAFHLSEGVVMIRDNNINNDDIFFVMTASHFSRLLDRGLDTFSREFLKEFGSVSMEFYGFMAFSKKRADQLIRKSFPYIPRYELEIE